MAKLFSALIFAAALSLGLGTVSSATYACNEKSAEAGDATSLMQLAQDESSDEGTDESTDGEDSSEDSGGEDASE